MAPSPGSASERVYSELKARIINLDLPPEAPLSPAAIAREFGVSRTPVRDALNRLSQEGFVQILPRQAYLVTPVTVQDVFDLFDYRLLLEEYTAGRAAERCTPADLAELERHAAVGYVIHDKESYRRYYDENKAFHLKLAEAAGNRIIVAALADVLDKMRRVLFLGLEYEDSSDQQVSEHLALLQALGRRDAEAARHIVSSHLLNARGRILERLHEWGKLRV